MFENWVANIIQEIETTKLIRYLNYYKWYHNNISDVLIALGATPRK